MAPALTEPLSPSEKLSPKLALSDPSAEESSSAASSTTTSTTAANGKRRPATLQHRQHQQQQTESVQGSAAKGRSTARRNEQMGLSAALSNNNNNNNNNHSNDNNNSKNINNNNNSSGKLNVEPAASESASHRDDENSRDRLLADLTSDCEEAIIADICLRNQRLVDFDKEVGVPAAASAKPPSHTFSLIEEACRVYTASEPSTLPNESHMESETGRSPNVRVANVNVEEAGALGLQEAVKAVAAEVATQGCDGDGDAPLSPEFYEKLQVEEDDTEEEEALKASLAAAAHDGAPGDCSAHGNSSTETHSSFDDSCISKKADDDHTVHITSVVELPPISTDSTMTASEVEDNLEERLSQLDGMPLAMPPASDTSAAMMGGVAPATPPQTPQHQHEALLATPTTQRRIAELQEQLQRKPGQHHHHGATGGLPTQASLASPTSGGRSSAVDTGPIEDQDIEEMLKVLKGMDPHDPATSDALCNLFFSEDCNALGYEEMTGGHSQASTSMAALNACATAVPNPSIVPAVPAAESHSAASSPFMNAQLEIGKKHQSLQRKLDFLDRRLRKLQARYMCRHTSEEIGGLLEYSLRVATKRSMPEEAADNPLGTTVISSRPRDDHWASRHTEPVFKAEMASMLRRIETVGASHTVCTTPSMHAATSLIGVTVVPPKKPRKNQQAAAEQHVGDMAASPSDPGATALKVEHVVVPAYDPYVSAEMSYVSEVLQTEMRQVQTAIDSDATESSSGADSADEMLTFSNQLQQSLPIAKRAAWRYACDRAATASRWSWLLSQIADLEIKIRQYQDLHQEVVRTKGAVISEAELEASAKAGVPPAAVASSGSVFNGGLDRFANKAVGQAATGAASLLSDEDDLTNALPGSCRTRGFVASVFRKRKLLQTTNIHQISKKAARPSTVKCGCETPVLPCAVCTGRADPTAPRDLPDTMMKPERIALLDAGYHPVLSFPQDVDSSIYLESIASSAEWQHRVLRCQVKSMAKSVRKAERAEAAGCSSYLSKKYGDMTPPHVKRRYIKKKDRLAAAAAAAAANDGAAPAYGGAATATSSGTVADGAQTVGNETRGNGIGTLSTSATPLGVANTVCGGANQMEILSPMAVLNQSYNRQWHQQRKRRRNNNAASTNRIRSRDPSYHDQYKPNQAHSSLISQTATPYNHYNHNSLSLKNNHKQRNNNKSLRIPMPSANNHTTSSTSSTATLNSHQLNNHRHHPQTPAYSNSNAQYNGNHNNSQNSNSESGVNLPLTDWEASSVRSRNSSPTHWGTNNYYKYERSTDRKHRTSYDIDNIVIPYSVAAATRVEILPYKEIPTPKWRVIEKENITKSADEGESQSSAADVLTNGVCAGEFREPGPAQSKASKGDEARDIREQQSSGAVDKTAAPRETADGVEARQTEPDAITSAPTFTNRVVILSEQNRLYGNEEEDRVNGGGSGDDDTVDEDITDDAITMRHERALTEERRKFQTFLKFPWSTRSRANRRIDSRAESSGANTPDPASPAPATPSIGGGDQESIPSPLAPSTPINPLDSACETATEAVTSAAMPTAVGNSKRLERRRTTSTKKEREVERRSATPDLRELIPPYERLQFPLTDEEFNNLLNSTPVEYPFDECFRFNKDFYNSNSGGSGHMRSTSRSRRNSVFQPISAPPTPGCAVSGTPTAAAAAATKRNSKSSSANCDALLSHKRKPHNNAASIRDDKDGATPITRGGGEAIAADAASSLPSTSTQPPQARLNGKLAVGGAPMRTGAAGGEGVAIASGDPVAPEVATGGGSVVSMDSQDEETADDDAGPDEGEDEEEEPEAEDDADSSKNFLLINDDDVDFGRLDTDSEDEYDEDDEFGGCGAFDDEFNVHMMQKKKRRRHNGLDGFSEDDSSDVDPFQDDDPNDPEWKGTLRRRRKL